MPRLGRVAGFVNALSDSVLAPLSADVHVRYAVFDGTFTALGDAQSAKTVLEQALTPVAGTAGDGDAGPSTAAGAARAQTKVAAQRRREAAQDPPVTDITTALEELRRSQRDEPLAAVFLLTDAAHNQHAGRPPQAAAAELSGTPVYVVPIGDTQHVRDLDLTAVSAPGVVMKDDDVVIEATVQAFRCGGESLRVELLRDGNVVQDRTLQLDSEMALRRVRFNTQLSEVGRQRFQVRVAPLAGEASEENNFDQFEVNVTRDHIRVLLADEMPRWEYRYLAQLFRRDRKVECDELLFRPRRIATGKRADSSEFPSTADEWSEYDVVLLGDVSSDNLAVAAQQSLAEFIRERGGTLVIIAGDGSMPQGYVHQPLEDLLPVAKLDGIPEGAARDGYALQVTDDGWQHHALMIADTQDATRIAWDFINRNSPLYGLSPYRHARPAARTLITAVPRAAGPVAGAEVTSEPGRSALLCWQPIGRGRVVFLASPESYRLRFLRGDRLHYRFWGQLLRWAIASDLAAGTQLVSIRTDRPDYRFGDSIQVAVRLTNEAGQPVAGARINAVAMDSDASRTEESRTVIPLQPDDSVPGRYVGSFARLPTGIYRVEPFGEDVDRLLAIARREDQGGDAAMASFTVRSPPNRERVDTRSDRALAQQIADASGGQVLPPTAVSEILALTDLAPIVTERTEVQPLWVQWKFLWIVFGCLFTEWAIRKHFGLS
jgi:hypothetical protein